MPILYNNIEDKDKVCINEYMCLSVWLQGLQPCWGQLNSLQIPHKPINEAQIVYIPNTS